MSDGHAVRTALERLESRLVEEFRATFAAAQELQAQSERLGARRLELEDEMHAVARARDLARRLP